MGSAAFTVSLSAYAKPAAPIKAMPDVDRT